MMNDNQEMRLGKIYDLARNLVDELKLARADGISELSLIEVSMSLLFGAADSFGKEMEVLALLPKLAASLRESAEAKMQDQKRQAFADLLEMIHPEWMPRA